MERVSAALDPSEKRKRVADSFSQSRLEQERTKGYRCAGVQCAVQVHSDGRIEIMEAQSGLQ